MPFTGKLIPEILELDGDREVMRPHCGYNALQLILTFARDTHFVALDLRSHLEFSFADEGRDLLGHFRIEPLFDLDDLARVAQRRNLRFRSFHVLQTDVSFCEA